MDETSLTLRRQMEIELPPLHRSQMAVATHPARFKVLAAGRRWGKSRLACLLCLITAMNKGGRCWWIAPSYPQSSAAWRELKLLAHQIPGRVVREDARRITLPRGGEIVVRSADAPDSLRGEGLDLVVVDEAAYVAADVWTDVLRPALSDRQGGALLISTPNGYDWFFDCFQRGQEARDDWQSWQFATSDNPLIPADELDSARESMPARSFEQEYLAQFLPDGAGVFRNVRAAATATPQQRAIDGHQYQFGVDWGRENDATCFAVWDCTTRELVYLDRFTGVEYAQQRGRLMSLVERFHPIVVTAEQNSIGGPIIEALQREGLRVRPFNTSNASKMAIVDALALSFERGDIRIIPDPVLLGELAAFGAERLQSGLLRYAARTGHDDTVMALAIVHHAATNVRTSSAVGAFVR